MNDKAKRNSIFLNSGFYLCLLVVIFVSFILIASLLTGKKTGFMTDGAVKYETGWYDLNGNEVSLDGLMQDNHVTICKMANGDVINNKSLCFFSKNVYFTVFMDDRVIYDYHPKPPAVFGKAYGVFAHVVTPPVLTDEGLLRIEIENIYPETEGFISDMELNNGTYFIVSEMQRSISVFLICLAIFAFGIVFFNIGIFGRYYGDKRFEIMSMGAFSMVVSLWIATEGTIMPLLTGLPIAIHFIDYMMLAVLPIPTVLFAAYISGNKDSKVVLVISAIAALNIFISVLFASLNLRDYHETLWVSHVILILMVVAVLYFFIRSIAEKKLKKGVIIVLTITFLLPLTIGATELLRYRINPTEYVGRPYYQFVLFLFIFLCSGYEFVSLSEMSKKSQYAEIMEQIAYTDGLTGLLNREAYNDEMDAQKDGNISGTVVVLDMNHLKKVNDRLGHAVGDEYIKKLAQCIRESFECDKCFRMGGDEFLVLSKMKSSNSEFHNALAKLNQQIENYNSERKLEIPLSVAIGYADYDSAKNSMEDIIRKADERMYEQKKTMKMEIANKE